MLDGPTMDQSRIMDIIERSQLRCSELYRLVVHPRGPLYSAQGLWPVAAASFYLLYSRRGYALFVIYVKMCTLATALCRGQSAESGSGCPLGLALFQVPSSQFRSSGSARNLDTLSCMWSCTALQLDDDVRYSS